MLFGKHINKYYLRYSPVLILGILALVLVDVLQLEVPRLYKMVINGINDGSVEINGVLHEFNTEFLLDKICLPLIFIIIFMVIGRLLSGVHWFTDIVGGVLLSTGLVLMYRCLTSIKKYNWAGIDFVINICV